MYKKLFFLMVIISLGNDLYAQQDDIGNDTFFLARKKGLLGKLGRGIATYSPEGEPVKLTDPFKKYNGKFIRYIEVVPVGFNQNLNDTAEIYRNLAIRIAQKFHRNTKDEVIRKNLFFHEGEVFLPLLVSDNERFLRELPYIQDAVIVPYQSVMSRDSVDVIILTRDIFSIGGSINIRSIQEIRSEIKEENVGGTGNYIAMSSLLEKGRTPILAFGAEFTLRNIRKKFLNWTAGFNSFKPAIINGRYEESRLYSVLDKPMVSRYTEWTGALSLSYNRTRNAYSEQKIYEEKDRYRYLDLDVWGGYNIGFSRKRLTDSEKRLRHFVASRVFYKHFDHVPKIFTDSFDYNYTNLNGILFSYTLYKQNFYRTNFIYGFGRNEDVPVGLNASFTTGWTNRQGRRRGYYATDFQGSRFSKRGIFSSYTFRLGAYAGVSDIEDINMLMAVDHFTKLRKINTQWLNRNFVSISHARNFKHNLNEPLYLVSDYGLPEFSSDSTSIIRADARTTLKLETVFFNLRKFFGFRFAPFAFSSISFLRPMGESFGKTNGYSAVGGGVRTRNENLIFGTIELRGIYFPRISGDMNHWRIEINTKLRFKYNSSFIKKPDFIVTN
jgi:hypothetical protein